MSLVPDFGCPETRHEQLLRQVAVPEIPSVLSSREFLDGIYERAADASAAELDPRVAQSLAEPLEAPDLAPRGALPARSPLDSLRQMEGVSAPSWIRSRVRSDLVEWTRLRKQSRSRRRAGLVIAAAALVMLALPFFSARDFGKARDASGVARDSGGEIVILRHHVSRPLDPGMSTASIVATVDAGGSRVR